MERQLISLSHGITYNDDLFLVLTYHRMDMLPGMAPRMMRGAPCEAAWVSSMSLRGWVLDTCGLVKLERVPVRGPSTLEVSVTRPGLAPACQK